MKTKLFFLAAMATFALTSCVNDEFIGDPAASELGASDGSINFGMKFPAMTRAGEFTGATAAEKLGGMFVVEGTKGTEAADAPSSDVVFDNYLVGYEYNSAGTTESNTRNWEYVGKETGITGRMTSATWGALHPSGAGVATAQTVKYWDYSTSQYDFIAWSTGTCEAVTAAPTAGHVQVTRINKGSTLSGNGFTLAAANATDLSKCYYTDINKVVKANYGAPVTLTFKNMAAKVRIAFYETVPGYSVKNVVFYAADDDTPATPDDLGTGTSTTATLFTTGTGVDFLPQSGSVLVYYPHIGSGNSSLKDYDKASVTVTPGAAKSATQTFGTFPSTNIGETLTAATYAGAAADNYYTAVIPNTDGKALTLRVDYTLVSTDGSDEEIKVYGAKAVVPPTYTVWQPNYAYTYIFKISDNSNGWTSTDTANDPAGLFPITFDAVVASFTDVNAEQTTVTTVATPSITTYQQGHNHAAKNEYSKTQKAGADNVNYKDVYVQVMNNSGATPTLVSNLNTAGKSLLFKVTGVTPISEATVMDALQNRTNAYNAASPVGRNGLTLTANANIANDVTQIVNGVDDQPITEIAGAAIAAGQVAKIDIDNAGVTTGTYAYVYVTTIPTADEKVYNVVSAAIAEAAPTSYYEVDPSDLVPAVSATATANKVYFVANRDAQNNIVSYTFKQTKVGDSVTGLFEATIGANASDYTAGHFYFDVYNRNNGAYAVKVIKVVD